MNAAVTRATPFRAVSKLSRPIADATHSIPEIAFFIVELELAGGAAGQGYLLSFHYSPEAIRGALRDACAFAKGYQAWQTVKYREDIYRENEYFGQNGPQKCAAAVVNVAMWDAWGRTLGQPVWKLLGANAGRVPVYGSGGWLSYSDAELIEEVTDYKKRGFRSVKIKVGSPGGVAADLERLRLVREAVGDNVGIMMDANQGLELAAARELAERASRLNLGIRWFEEPIDHANYDGYKYLREKSGVSLATGEREYDLEPLKALIARNAIDLWQPDLIRIGGVEAWLDSASLANAYHIPVLPHYYRDYDVPLLCTLPNAYGVESFDWIDGIIDNRMRIEDGYAYPREEPGWGFRFKESALTPMR
ncbi:MAG: mandelate racemase/muconate lactonizing enzyme family protein [Planctomycetota bacterium]|jgi:L-alanine-DL-glutamate epimerase-like enolase superfamily enzyme|nr:mandelate racemase/muconate lactonizing enzyme family protein [Planctomycetota bacterium]